jgi:hypothetical protein
VELASFIALPEMAENFWTTSRSRLKHLRNRSNARDAWVLKKRFGRIVRNAESGLA